MTAGKQPRPDTIGRVKAMTATQVGVLFEGFKEGSDPMYLKKDAPSDGKLFYCKRKLWDVRGARFQAEKPQRCPMRNWTCLHGGGHDLHSVCVVTGKHRCLGLSLSSHCYRCSTWLTVTSTWILRNIGRFRHPSRWIHVFPQTQSVCSPPHLGGKLKARERV